MDEFELLLTQHKTALKRFVRFKISDREDAEDIIQEVLIAAYRQYGQLKRKESFQSWLIGIARNKCMDWYRKKAAVMEISLEALTEKAVGYNRMGLTVRETVRETLDALPDKDRQILYLYYFKELPQQEIAKRLQIPLGTVKSRLYTAKQNFKQQYPYRKEGENDMKKLPKVLPAYKITKSDKKPFDVKWEELMGWFLVPKLGEKLSWGMYDLPSRKCSHVYDMQVTGKAKVHGIEGVELTAREASYLDRSEVTNRTFVAQLTDTHCRYLATLRNDGDVRNYITFLDGDAFLDNWGFGEDNCGNETNLTVKGDITREEDVITSAEKDFLLDVVGRYTVEIGGRSYDTVCVIDIDTYNNGVMSEQYIDANGRTVLWRRFNRDDWALDHYGKLWSEQLSENENRYVNGKVYVEWYDCISDYIL